MKFLIDESLSPKLLEYFQEAEHVYTAMSPGDSDQAILRFAGTRDFVVVTGDTDFGGLLAASGSSTPSVILVRALLHLPVHEQGRIIAANLGQLEAVLRDGAVVVITDRDIRVRALPII